MQKKSHKTSQKQAQIFGVGLNSTSIDQVLTEISNRIARFSKNDSPFVIYTPNPEIVLEANSDLPFKKILNSSDINIPDGLGLAQAVTFYSWKFPQIPLIKEAAILIQGVWVGLLSIVKPKSVMKEIKIVKGRVLFKKIVRTANKKGWKAFLLGGEGEEAILAKEVLRKEYKNLRISSMQGPMLDKNGLPRTIEEKKIQKDAIDTISRYSPDVLFVGFGAPKQEKWIYGNKNKLNTKVIMAVGGTFNYISGKSKLPPSWISDLGLEWIWRLITEPKRIKRILKAFPVFPFVVFWQKLTKNTP